VLAAGDAARTRGADGAPLPRFEHWEAAERGGLTVAATLLGQAPPAPTVPRFWSERYGRHVEVLGQIADAATTVRRGDLGAPRSAVLGLDGDRLVAAVVLDDPRATRALRRVIDRGLSVDAAVLADPTTDLRRLSKH
jgi:NADPH-dependent 2,4-dienoyl-CoA reductase/sulfur reductase-like enzyme